MACIADSLDLGSANLLSISFDGVEDVQLTQARSEGRCVRRGDLVLSPAEAFDLSAPLGDGVREALDVLWQSAGWPDGSPCCGDDAWAGYTDERTYARTSLRGRPEHVDQAPPTRARRPSDPTSSGKFQ